MNYLFSSSARWLVAGLGLLLGQLAQSAHAQSPGSGGPAPQAPTAVPLDGGAGLLLVAGVGLGLKKLRQRASRRRYLLRRTH